MTHPALEALRVARDAELLATDAAAHGDSETWTRESLRAQTIIACEVESDIGRWVQCTRRERPHFHTRGVPRIGNARIGEWGPPELSRSSRSGNPNGAPQGMVLGADGNARSSRFTLDVSAERHERPSLGDKERGRAFLESLRSHRRRRGHS